MVNVIDGKAQRCVHTKSDGRHAMRSFQAIDTILLQNDGVLAIGQWSALDCCVRLRDRRRRKSDPITDVAPILNMALL